MSSSSDRDRIMELEYSVGLLSERIEFLAGRMIVKKPAGRKAKPRKPKVFKTDAARKVSEALTLSWAKRRQESIIGGA